MKMDVSYLLYFLIAVGIAAISGIAFNRFNGKPTMASRQDDQAFERKMAELEKRAEQAGLKRTDSQGHDTRNG